MNITPDFIFGYILLIHFLADFGLQTHDQATKKGEGNSILNPGLFQHVGVYSIIWFIAIQIIVQDRFIAFNFAATTFICHYFTDYITSRLSKPFFNKQDLHNGFVIIGFDQILHYFQLWYTFKFLNIF